MFYLAMGIVFVLGAYKSLREYFWMESFLKHKEPVYVESFEPHSLYTDSVNGVINTLPYQKEG